MFTQQSQRQGEEEIGNQHGWNKCRYSLLHLVNNYKPMLQPGICLDSASTRLTKLVTAAYCNEGGIELAKALLQAPPHDPPPRSRQK